MFEPNHTSNSEIHFALEQVQEAWIYVVKRSSISTV